MKPRQVCYVVFVSLLAGLLGSLLFQRERTPLPPQGVHVYQQRFGGWQEVKIHDAVIGDDTMVIQYKDDRIILLVQFVNRGIEMTPEGPFFHADQSDKESFQPRHMPTATAIRDQR